MGIIYIYELKSYLTMSLSLDTYYSIIFLVDKKILVKGKSSLVKDYILVISMPIIINK